MVSPNKEQHDLTLTLHKQILEYGKEISNEDYSALFGLIDERETRLGHPEVTLDYRSHDSLCFSGIRLNQRKVSLTIFVQPVEEFDLFGSRMIYTPKSVWRDEGWDIMLCVVLVPGKLLEDFHAAIERDPNGHDPTEVDDIRRSIEIEITKLIHPLAMALCRSLREYHESKKGSEKAS